MSSQQQETHSRHGRQTAEKLKMNTDSPDIMVAIDLGTTYTGELSPRPYGPNDAHC